MAYLSKKSVLDSIVERKKRVGTGEYTTYEAYVGINPITGKQVRFSRSEKAELKDAVEGFYKRLRSGGDAGGTLTAAQSVDALQAIRALSDAKVDMTLLECVKKLLEYRLVGDEKPRSVTLGDAYAEYLGTFSDETENKRTVTVRVGKWANDFGMERFVTEVTEKDIVDWIARYDNPKTWNNHMTYIRTFFNWCAEKNRRYVLENPLECAKAKAVKAKRPEFAPSDTVRKMFGVLWKLRKERPELLAYATVSYFAGLRREEIFRAAEHGDDAVKFDFEHNTVVVVLVKGYTQGRKPRSFPMSKAFRAWAESFDFAAGMRRINAHVVFNIRCACEKESVGFPKNAGRHTFISQYLALTQNVDLVAQTAGTSPQMIRDNYNALSFKDDATAFFSIRPPVD